MKNLSIIIVALLLLGISSCSKKYAGDSFDTSTSLPPYVEFTSKAAKTVQQGQSITVPVQMKTALTEDVTVTYQITGISPTKTGTIVIPRNTVKATATITIPTGIVAAPGTSVAAQLKLVSAVRGTEALRVGYKDPSSEVINLKITF